MTLGKVAVFACASLFAFSCRTSPESAKTKDIISDSSPAPARAFMGKADFSAKLQGMIRDSGVKSYCVQRVALDTAYNHYLEISSQDCPSGAEALAAKDSITVRLELISDGGSKDQYRIYQDDGGGRSLGEGTMRGKDFTINELCTGLWYSSKCSLVVKDGMIAEIN